ncbi:M4 family metallopeptidase [Streptomyces sp. NBC_00090]
MVAVALPASAATAGTTAVGGKAAGAGPAPRAGALPVRLSPAEHAALVADAQAARATTAKALGLGAKEELRPKSVLKDADGTLHTRYERTFAGLPVLGGDLVVHTGANGTARGVTKNTQATITVASTTAAKSAESAKSFALGEAKAEGAKDPKADSVRKVVWAASGKPVLAWESVVGGVQHDGTPSRLHVITDATTGAELFEYQAVNTGTGTGQYAGQVTIGTSLSGSTYQLDDTTRGGHKTYDMNDSTYSSGILFTDADDVWGDGLPSNRQTAAVDAAYGAQLTWDYYKNVHGRNGIRNDGVASNSRVHYGDRYSNAFWDDYCFCMTYGDGKENAKPFTSVDVAAHEVTHGLTSNTAGLVYSGESGGLNEATSDIIGTAVEFWANNPSDPGDYLLGEEVGYRGAGIPLRYMDQPSKDGKGADSWYSGVGGIDVHYSSGIGNHWFYLASEGSGSKVLGGVSYSSPTSDGLAVDPVGRDAAAKIWYRALTTYMTSSTNYAGARTATLQAAADLYGNGSATYDNVANAWAAVNVGSRADGVKLTNPPAQNTLVNTAASLQFQASGAPRKSKLTYSATGLPAGLSINASTGLISGTPTAPGTVNVTVTVTDSTGGAATARLTWSVLRFTGGNTTDVTITDNGPAVYSPITVTGVSGNASAAVKVDVDIKHSLQGELQVDLVAPDGTAYRLKDADFYSGTGNLIKTYIVDVSSEVANGTWKLQVEDTILGDVGYIDSWKLTF